MPVDFDEFKKRMIQKDQSWGYGGREAALRAEYEKYLATEVPEETSAKSLEPESENQSVLTTCRTCDGKVSSTAPTCPHCGETSPGRRDSATETTEAKPEPEPSVEDQTPALTTKCNTCGKEVSISAKACPNCGASDPAVSDSDKLVGFVVAVAVVAGIWWYISGGELPQKTSNLPNSRATYFEVDRAVGCGSDYSDARKDDIFESRYKDHWMTWKGEVVLADADDVSLNIDGKGTQDLMVYFEDDRAGYSLREGQNVTVRFVMKSMGGCFLPFTGKHGRLL